MCMIETKHRVWFQTKAVVHQMKHLRIHDFSRVSVPICYSDTKHFFE